MSTLCSSKSLTPEEPDEAVERLVERRPDIDMSTEEELQPGLRHWRVPFRRRRLLGCDIRTWSVFVRSFLVPGMRFSVGYAGVTRPRV